MGLFFPKPTKRPKKKPKPIARKCLKPRRKLAKPLKTRMAQKLPSRRKRIAMGARHAFRGYDPCQPKAQTPQD
jgi:hypothetical protein